MFYEGKNVLVTGGAGFVGTNLIRALSALGAEVRGTVHERPARFHAANVSYTQADLLRRQDCRSVCEGMDLVFVCAANTSGAAVMARTPLVHLTPNLVMNAQLLEGAYEAGVKKLLFISSNTVYPVSDSAVKEGDVTNVFFEKYHVVAWMKRFTEIMCDMYATRLSRPMPCVVVRPANAYGPYDKFDPERSHVLPALIRKVVARLDPLPVWGDGLDIKDFIYIDDLVEGLLLAMEKLDGTQPVNLASGRPCRLRDVLTLILELDGYEGANVTYDERQPTMIPKRLIDPTFARNRLGFEARTSLRDGLAETIRWYRHSSDAGIVC